MTLAQIEKQAAREMKKFEIAKQIRSLLDAAKKEYGASDWSDEDMEGEISRLVFED